MIHPKMANNPFLFLGAISGFLSVLFGAFAAHGLKHSLTEYQLSIIDTGVRYQMYHSIAIILGCLILTQSKETTKAPLWLFCIGISFFSGSLYLLALTGAKWLGPITPLGGMCFIAGWIWLAVVVVKTPPLLAEK